MSEADLVRRAFILDNTRLLAPPLVPELKLWLADDPCSIWKNDRRNARRLDPAAAVLGVRLGGRASARPLHSRSPGVRARPPDARFRLGSGLVAIAAALAGAASVEASDIDVFARAAIRANADENGVAVTAGSKT